MIPAPWLIGGSVAAFAVWTVLVYDKGGDAREHAIEARLAAEAKAAKEEDDEAQRAFVRVSETEYQNRIAERDRIIRSLQREDDGDLCSTIDDGQRVRDGWFYLFGPEVRSGGGADGSEPTP